MISEADVAFYQQHGYLVVQDVLSRSEVEELRRVTDELVEKARDVSAHDDIYDLEDGHSADSPECAGSRPRTCGIRRMRTWCAIPISSRS